MNLLVEGEVVAYKFEGGLSCKKRLFFGEIVLTNYRLIMASKSIQRNPGGRSEIWNHPLRKISTARIKRDRFLAKLNKQKLAEKLLPLEKMYQFPTTKVLKKKAKKYLFAYNAVLEYEDGGTVKKEIIKVIIKPKMNRTLGNKFYKEKCEEIFNALDKALKIE